MKTRANCNFGAVDVGTFQGQTLIIVIVTCLDKSTTLLKSMGRINYLLVHYITLHCSALRASARLERCR